MESDGESCEHVSAAKRQCLDEILLSQLHTLQSSRLSKLLLQAVAANHTAARKGSPLSDRGREHRTFLPRSGSQVACMAAVTVASVATAVEWPAAAAVCSCEVTAFMGTVPAAAAAADLRNSRTKPV